MPFAAPEAIDKRTLVDPREDYRYGSVDRKVSAQPIDAFERPSGPLQNVLNLVNSVQGTLGAYGQFQDQKNKADEEQGGMAQIKGETPPSDASMAFIRGYNRLQGEADASKYHATMDTYYRENWNKPPGDFEAGVHTIDNQFILGQSDSYLKGFAPRALIVQDHFRQRYADDQAVQAKEKMAENLKTKFDADLTSIYQNYLVNNPVSAPVIPPTEVDRVMNAFKTVESGGKTGAVGPDGSLGTYQYQPKTWQDYSTQYNTAVNGVATPLPMNPTNQELVTRFKMTQFIHQGYNLKQIAAIWQSGSPGGTSLKGVNPETGVAYDVPAYTAKIEAAYNAGGGGVTGTSSYRDPNPLAEALNAARVQALQDIPPGMTKKDVNLAFIQKAHELAILNHDENIMRFGWVEDKSGWSVAKLAETDLQGALLEGLKQAESSREAWENRQWADKTKLREETQRNTMQAVADIYANTSDKVQAGMMIQNYVKANATRLPPESVFHLMDMGQKMAASDFAQNDDPAVLRDLYVQASEGRLAPATLNASLSKLTEKCYFMILDKKNSEDKATQNREYAQSKSDQMETLGILQKELSRPDMDMITKEMQRSGIVPFDPMAFTRNEHGTYTFWKKLEEFQTDLKGKGLPLREPTTSELHKIYQDTLTETMEKLPRKQNSLDIAPGAGPTRKGPLNPSQQETVDRLNAQIAKEKAVATPPTPKPASPAFAENTLKAQVPTWDMRPIDATLDTIHHLESIGGSKEDHIKGMTQYIAQQLSTGRGGLVDTEGLSNALTPLFNFLFPKPKGN